MTTTYTARSFIIERVVVLCNVHTYENFSLLLGKISLERRTRERVLLSVNYLKQQPFVAAVPGDM